MDEVATADAVETKARKLRLGQKIVAAREAKGLSARALAERLVNRTRPQLEQGGGEWHRAVVSMMRSLRRYENGHNSPRDSLMLLAAIAEETGVGLDHFSIDDDEELDAMRARARELIAPFQRRNGRGAARRVPGPSGKKKGRR